MTPALSDSGQTGSTPPTLLERAFEDVFSEGAVTDRSKTRLLDAASELFAKLGIQRTSMEEVAKGAGLSRVTIYRKFSTKDDLVEQVMMREFRRYFEQFLRDVAPARSAEERLVRGFVSALRTVSSNPLIGGMLQAEPDQVIVSMMGDNGGMLAVVSAFVAEQLRAEQRAGNVSVEIDTGMTAEMLVRMSASFLTIPSTNVDLTDEDRLAEIAWEYLVPMLTPADHLPTPSAD